MIGSTIDMDADILHASKNPILDQIRKDRRSRSLCSTTSMRSKLSDCYESTENTSRRSVENTNRGSTSSEESSIENLAQEIKTLNQQLTELRRKRLLLGNYGAMTGE